MKAPNDWIRELVPEYKGSPKTTAEVLTFSGTEVENLKEIGKDGVLECAVTSNRVDCFGIAGIARDVAAVKKKRLAPPDATVAFTAPPTAERLSVTVEAPDFCPRYCAFVIEGLTVGPSPDWLVARLAKMGLKPINNVVDVTNYVLFELNQPLHAFDLDLLRGKAIVVRRARAGEKITALNEHVYELQPWMGVIADAERPVAIAGVMGGLDTAVTASTKRIVIESAWFDPASIRKSSRALGLASDSSFRFERGIDVAGAHRAACRAAKLMLEVAGGELRSDPIDAGAPVPPREPIALRLKRARDVTGTAISARRAQEILQALGCEVAEAGAGALTVTPPTWRADLTREIDLIEELIRIVGLDRVPEGSGLAVRPVAKHPGRRFAETVKDRLVSYGFLECVTPTFVPEGASAEVAFLDGGPALRARNPVRTREGVIRRSLLPSLLEVRRHNQDHGNDDLALFEVSALAFETPGALPKQIQAAGMLADRTFRDLKGIVATIGDALGIDLRLEPGSSPHLQPDAQGVIAAAEGPVGVIGAVAPSLVDFYKLKTPPCFCELDLTALLPGWQQHRRFKDLPRLPAVRRDFAFVVDAGRTWAELEGAIRGAGVAEVESIDFFDEYRGAQVGPGKKSLALTVAFRPATETFRPEQIEAMVARIVEAAADRCGATLRG
jgi:phenylalanyl-tRNA synthetase beta chain